MKVAIALLGFLSTACAAPLEFPDWLVPVADGTRIIEYRGLPPEQREERIDLVTDLVVGDVSDDPNASFYRTGDLAVARDGRIYVHDTGNHRIQVFAPDGSYLFTVGREGQGPGEIGAGGEMEIVGDRLVRSGDYRLSAWTLDGEFLGDAPVQDGERLLNVAALGIDSLLAGVTGPRLEDQPIYVRLVDIVRVSADGSLAREYASMRQAASLFSVSARAGGFFGVEVPGEAPGYVATPAVSVLLQLLDHGCASILNVVTMLQ